MINVENICLTLKNRDILTSVSITMEPGNIYGLVGNNGSGKTMLMKVICGLVKPTSGTVTCDGTIIGKDRDYLPDAGIIIETPGFISYYSGFKNLKFLAGIRGKIGNEEIRKAMEDVGLDPKLRLPVRKYSLGMRQRLGIAQAIMENPRYLVFDEPMNGLDKNGIAQARKLLLDRKAAGATIILSSHNREDIDILCDHVYEMEQGHMTEVKA
ncbi:MAG: ATP-binding cassette domain-containing protein [Butyrivibrio sp.]